MPIDDPDDLDRVDREIRINELMHEHDDDPSEEAEAFFRHVVEYESAPLTTHTDELEADGVKLPAPDSLTDAELTAKLWQVIRRLGEKHIFISSTDHLSDRELYTHLLSTSLREGVPRMTFNKRACYHIDIIGSGNEEHTYLYLKFYADKRARRSWMRDFPDYDMPASEKPPHDRDRLLPKMQWPPEEDDGEHDGGEYLPEDKG